jgi:ssDNA-specific exonuclease RecJ
MEWLKKPFRLYPSFQENDPDYYTAIYSPNIDKFKELFDTLRGSKELYFTPTERSLLTHELLTRAHFNCDDDNDDDDDDEDDQQSQVVIRPS